MAKSIIEYRIDKVTASDSALIEPGKVAKQHAVKTKYGFDRVVEDFIQEAMSKGDFDNLEGCGKPLSSVQSQNPYVDFTQYKINKILLDNGFTPEWITLQKDIRSDINDLIQTVSHERSYFSAEMTSVSLAADWAKVLEARQYRVHAINKKIDKYNLMYNQSAG